MHVNETSDTVPHDKGHVETSVGPLKSFILMEETRNLLELALAAEQNVILFGKGGYGKSEFSIEFLKSKGIQPFVLTMGTGMTTERMFGGFDLHTFNTTGKMEYLVENSFMNAEFVVFEELFDAPDYILEQLKDILSSGIFRNGSQVYPIKTKVIICCTNKTRKEFSKNLSLKALMERFPLEHEVKWESHTADNYRKLFIAKFGDSDSFLEKLLETFDTEGHTISPRIALAAFDIVKIGGYDCLKYIADFAANPEILSKATRNYAIIQEYNKLKDNVTVKCNEIATLLPKLHSESSLSEVKHIKTILEDLKIAFAEFRKLTLPDELISESVTITTNVTRIMSDTQATLDLL